MRFLAWAIVVVLIAATVLIARGAEMPPVMLVDHAAVNHARITLADLLPGAASPALQVRAAQFDLGRAPQVGAARVLEREWLRGRLGESEFSVLALPPRIVVERASWNNAARERVKAAVRNYLNAKIGSRAAGSPDFLWPANVPHLKPEASLDVVSGQWDDRTRTLQLRIACSARRACLPFYVTLQFAGSPAELRQVAGKLAHPRRSTAQVEDAESEKTARVAPSTEEACARAHPGGNPGQHDCGDPRDSHFHAGDVSRARGGGTDHPRAQSGFETHFACPGGGPRPRARPRVGSLTMTIPLLVLLVFTIPLFGHKQHPEDNLAAYIARIQQSQTAPAPATSMGSLWTPQGRFTNIEGDYKALSVGDIITIRIVEDTSAQNTGSTAANRAFSAQSAITGLPGRIKTGGVNPLFGANSTSDLKGKGQAATTTRLRTSVAGR